MIYRGRTVTAPRHKQRKKLVMSQIRAVAEILKRWDPIGVCPGEFAPADEYDDYAPHIVTLVAQGISIEQLTRHLEAIRTQRIGIEAHRRHDQTIAKEIIRTLRFKLA
jgi:hypothetical protein